MKIVICCKTLAPYRVDLYSTINDLSNNQTRVLVGENPRDHGWKDLENSNESLFRMMKTYKLQFKLFKKLGFTSVEDSRILIPTLQYYKQLKKINPAIVWMHELSPLSLLAYFYAKMNGKKIVMSTELGSSISGQYSWFVRCIHKYFGARVDGIIANSASARNPIADSQKNIIFAPHAVLSDQYEPVLQNEIKGSLKLIFVGNIIARKGIDILIKALEKVIPVADGSGVSLSLDVVGGGDKEWLNSLVEEAGIGKYVRLLGFLEGEALKRAYGNSDIKVLPSRFDSYGVVTHEAACSGLVLLISDACGSAEILVEDGVNGYIVEANNIDSLTNKMMELVEQKDKIQEMKLASRRIGEKYCVRNTAANIYHSFGSL